MISGKKAWSRREQSRPEISRIWVSTGFTAWSQMRWTRRRPVCMGGEPCLNSRMPYLRWLPVVATNSSMIGPCPSCWLVNTKAGSLGAARACLLWSWSVAPFVKERISVGNISVKPTTPFKATLSMRQLGHLTRRPLGGLIAARDQAAGHGVTGPQGREMQRWGCHRHRLSAASGSLCNARSPQSVRLPVTGRPSCSGTEREAWPFVFPAMTGQGQQRRLQ